MKREETFTKSVVRVALPVTLQTLLQSSFSVIDQVMIGRLGGSSIAAVGLGGKFATLYSVLLGAVAAAAGIMISQYAGRRDEREISRGFFANLFAAAGLAGAFFIICILFGQPVMGLYTQDGATGALAADYLGIFAYSFLPMAAGTLAATLLRCLGGTAFPLYAGIAGVLLNTGLNYILIFGKGGFPALGVEGAAAASVVSQTASCLLTVYFLVRYLRIQNIRLCFLWRFDSSGKRQYLGILCPIIVCEFFWSLGENVYTAIYGNIGTVACAAMTLTVPVQTLLIGGLSGLGQAAGILVGRSLGNREYDRAYADSKRLMYYGLFGSLLLSAVLAAAGGRYVDIYRTEPQIRAYAEQILLVFALISPVKVQNMILGGGIIRSGGKTKYVMAVDLIGTWLFGVPLGLLAAFLWHMSIAPVYFMLSMEECVRLGISLVIFKRRIWMKRLD